jgi:hypothetical protein
LIACTITLARRSVSVRARSIASSTHDGGAFPDPSAWRAIASHSSTRRERTESGTSTESQVGTSVVAELDRRELLLKAVEFRTADQLRIVSSV